MKLRSSLATTSFGEGWYYRCIGVDPMKLLLVPKMKRSGSGKGQNRMLISVNVIGSAGPIRLVVNEDDVVANVIGSVLKNYAREGRLPVLGSDARDFLLFCPAAESDFLDPMEKIVQCGARNFLLCKKLETGADDDMKDEAVAVKASGKGIGALKSCFTKPVISAH